MSNKKIHSEPIALLSLEEVAQRYSATPRTVQNWLKSNPNFPQPIRFSRRVVRFRLADLERFESGQ